MSVKDLLSKLNLSAKIAGLKEKLSSLRKRKDASAAFAADEKTDPAIPMPEASAPVESDDAGSSDQLIEAPRASWLKAIGPALKARFAAAGAAIAAVLPKNLDELKSLSPDELMERFRQLTGGRAYGTYLRLGAATLASYFLADTVSLFTDSLIPDPPAVPAPMVVRKNDKERSVDEFGAITSRNIFNSKGIIPDTEVNPNGPARKTNLPIVLIGTVVLKDELKSIATIEDKSQNMVFPVRIDDVVSDKIQIKKIEHLKVTFVNRSTGALEYVEIIEDLPTLRLETTKAPKARGDGGISAASDTQFTIESKVIKDGMANLNEVLQQARAIPNFENGVPDGYKILQIVPGSIFDKLGIKNGDVIVGLNGEPVNDPGKALGLLNDLPNARNVQIAVKRNGKKMNMNYDIR